MSWSAVRYVYSLPAVAPNGERITSTEMGVLAAIANRVNHESLDCFPSVDLIAADSKASIPVVNRVLVRLKAKGLLHIKACYRKDGGRTSNRYSLPGFTGDNFELAPIKTEEKPAIVMDTPSITSRSNNREELTTKLIAKTNLSFAAPAEQVADPPSKKTANKHFREDDPLTPDYRRVRDHIVTEFPNLPKLMFIKLSEHIVGAVKAFGADELLAWHKAAVANNGGGYVRIEWAHEKLPAWRKQPEGGRYVKQRDAAVTGVVAATKKYGDNETYRRMAADWEAGNKLYEERVRNAVYPEWTAQYTPEPRRSDP
jgi:hypothetical protein